MPASASAHPDTAAAGLRAVRDLAAIVLIGVKAVEGVIEVLADHPRVVSAPTGGWSRSGRYQAGYEPDYDRGYEDLEEDEP